MPILSMRIRENEGWSHLMAMRFPTGNEPESPNKPMKRIHSSHRLLFLEPAHFLGYHQSGKARKTRRMDFSRRWFVKILRAFQAVFYALFVFLWFKDNFPPLRKIPISPVYPLACLAVVLILRALLELKRAGPRTGRRIRLHVSKGWAVPVLIILLATAVRIPYLVHDYGLMDSDEAIPALQGKHIAEGMRPAIYYYGALFQGSLPQHYYALLFKIFGYSVFLTKLAAYLAFVAFLVVQYALLHRIFGRGFAAAAGLFYALPFMHLILASFDVGSGFAVIFLLAALIFYLTYLIYEKHNERLTAPLGFLMGLAFWTHQVSVVFILSAAVFLVLHYRLHIKPYLTLGLNFLLGILPILMSEVYWKFPLVRMLFGTGEGEQAAGSKMARAKRLFLTLFSSGPPPLDIVYFLFFALGIAVLVWISLKNRRALFSGLFAVYVFAFAAVYFLSRFSSTEAIRYLYVLYIALPAIFVSSVLWIRLRPVRYGIVAVLYVFLFFVSSGRTSLAYYRSVSDRDKDIRDVTAAMADTGEKFWKAHYWISYLINAVSRERFIVASTTTERYLYYELIYDTEATGTNRIFLRDSAEEDKRAAEFIAQMERLRKTFRIKRIRQWDLVYGIRGQVYPKNLFFPPDEVPDVAFEGLKATETGLAFHFVAKRPILAGGYRLHVEIVGYCSRFRPLDLGDRFTIPMPFSPPGRVRLRYYLDFQGLVLDSTEQELEIMIPPEPSGYHKSDVEYLSGFGPREKIMDKDWVACDRDIRFEVNRPLKKASEVVVNLYSPFIFDDPWWHGDFAQRADVFVNGRKVLARKLADGHNTLVIDSGIASFKEPPNLIEIKFKYALVISIRDHWRTAAYLEGIEFKEKR
jgi:hypothetical protein